MSFQLQVPPSLVAKLAKAGEEDKDGLQKKSREDYRKLKELEEARKAGTAPAMKDEEGNDINPHIPQYIMQAPWYIGSLVPTLKHQRVQDEKIKESVPLSDWYKRGVSKKSAGKYRPGACDNCGATTHKKKDCMERPRKLGAKFTGKGIACDEFVQPNLEFDFEGKRDRWNGYDLDLHKNVVEEYAKVDEAKRIIKAKEFEQDLEENVEAIIEKETARDSEGEDDEDKYAEEADMPGQKFETKQRITVRNLRIREDTAKYLINLNVNSAYYDPKTRSMRGNPYDGLAQEANTDQNYLGDNFVRYSGDAPELAKRQLFAWEAYERGADVHLQADPTKLELLSSEFVHRKEDYKKKSQSSILEKYGGKEHLEALPKELLLDHTENYVEYSRSGAVIKGAEILPSKSRYLEDVFPGNHSSVWGSYWLNGCWGFSCCQQTVKNSYCTGQAGKYRLDIEETPKPTELSNPKEIEVEETIASCSDTDSDEKKESLWEMHQNELLKQKEKEFRKREQRKEKRRKRKLEKKKRKKKKKKENSTEESDSDSDDNSEGISKKRLKKALKREDERQTTIDPDIDDRDRGYNVMYDNKKVTVEEVEAWQMRRVRADDPMLNFNPS